MILEKLVSLSFHLFVVVLVLVILGGFYYVLVHGDKTPADRDGARFIADAKDVIKADTAISITVPLEASEPFLIVAYPPGEAPAACGNKACICTYVKQEGSYLEKCKVFGNICKCPDGCSTKSCLVERIEIPSKKQITIARDGCGRLSLI